VGFGASAAFCGAAAGAGALVLHAATAADPANIAAACKNRRRVAIREIPSMESSPTRDGEPLYAALKVAGRCYDRRMPKIKHIAISTQDVDETARFYIDVFGLKEVGKVDSPGASGYYLSDGNLNLAILKFKNDAVAGAERGKQWSGIHHIGFQVESLDEIAKKLDAAGSSPRDDVNQALGVGQGARHGGNVEVKYNGPDGVMVDVSETGWVGTSPLQ